MKFNDIQLFLFSESKYIANNTVEQQGENCETDTFMTLKMLCGSSITRMIGF